MSTPSLSTPHWPKSRGHINFLLASLAEFAPTFKTVAPPVAHSNLGRGPRRATVAHGHTYAVNSPLNTMARPKFAPKSTPSRGPIAKPHTSSQDPSDLRCQTASGSDPPFFHNALDRPTDRRTDRPTDQQIVHGKV